MPVKEIKISIRHQRGKKVYDLALRRVNVSHVHNITKNVILDISTHDTKKALVLSAYYLHNTGIVEC